MRRQYGLLFRTLGVAAFSVVSGCALSACAPSSPALWHRGSDVQTPALDEPAATCWRARLPIRWRGELASLCRLCDEYDLIEIGSARQWRAFCGAAGIDPNGLVPDFACGRVIGVVAYLGEPVKGGWPVEIDRIGCRRQSTWIQARLRTDLFYPVVGPGFCTFTYVRWPYSVNLVKVAHRLFFVSG